MSASARHGEGAAGPPRRLRHDQPQDQHPPDRVRRGLSRRARHRQPARADGRRAEVEPVCHHRPDAGIGGIALSGHTDVVPVAGQAWDTDPFTLIERDGKLYGRGTCDMKGYLACALAMVPDLKARKLKMPFHLAFSYDEEVGCTGVRPMIGRARQDAAAPALRVRRRAEQHDRGRRPQGPRALARRADGPRRALEHAALSASTPSPTPAA